MIDRDFSLPMKLKAQAPALYEIYQQDVSVLNHMLGNYKKVLPVPDDYTALHSLDMEEACGNLLTPESLDSLTPEECFLLLISCYMQDIGWSASRRLVALFTESQGLPPCRDDQEIQALIRSRHLELNSFMIRHYQELFDFPSPEMAEYVARICEATADTLKDPANWEAPGIRLHDLAVLIHIANQATRVIGYNQDVSWEMMKQRGREDILGFAGRQATLGLTYEGRDIILHVKGSDTVYELMKLQVEKMSARMAELAAGMTHLNLARDRIRIDRKISPDGHNAYLNREIEGNWTEKDWERFRLFSSKEKELYLHYLAVEYIVTKMLKEFAEARDLELKALEHRVKSPASVYEKIYVRKMPFTLETLNDMLRYTMILPEDIYVASAEELLETLEGMGLKVNMARNAWLQTEIPYNGLNVKLDSPNGFHVEIQFHTPDSLRISKSPEDHLLYEQKRLLEPGSPEYLEIERKQFELYGQMARPVGIENFRWN